MGASAGWSETRTRGVPEIDLCKTAKERPAKIGSGMAATCGSMECGVEHAWSRRTRQSASAGFCAACRSSETETTGNRISRSTARATNCIRQSRIRRSGPARGAIRSHRQYIAAAKTTQARLRNNSILRTDSTSSLHVSGKGIMYRIFNACQ